MNIKATIQFIEFNTFYTEYAPLTPYGQLDKNKHVIISDKDKLNATYHSIAKIVDFIKTNSFEFDKLQNHLKKISQLNSLERKSYDSSDIFLILSLIHI